MQQSGIVRFDTQGNPERINDLRDAPFCSQLVFAQMLGMEQITEDVVRGWVETSTIPTVKIGRRRVVNLVRIRRDIERGKTVFCAGDYADAPEDDAAAVDASLEAGRGNQVVTPALSVGGPVAKAVAEVQRGEP